MSKIKLRASTESGESFDELIIDVSIEEQELFREFKLNLANLYQCRIFENGFPVIEKIEFKNGGFSIKVKDYDYRDIYEFLHVARPLFLDKEPASFQMVCNILGQKFKGTSFSKHLKQIRRLYSHGELRDFMQISFNDVPLLDEKILNIWLNGEHYHHDPEKRVFIKELEQSFGQIESRGVFVSILAGRIKALNKIKYILDLCL